MIMVKDYRLGVNIHRKCCMLKDHEIIFSCTQIYNVLKMVMIIKTITECNE